MDLNKITYLLVTGASRGIGQTTAIELSKKISPGSLIVLLARSVSGLESTKSQILAINNSFHVITAPVDLANASKEEMEEAIQRSLKNHTVNEFQRALIVHNAGTPGDTGKSAKELNNLDSWVDYYKLNVFSVGILNSIFMKTFQEIDKVVVNVTSLCGIQPFNSLTYYCTGKAAREMYFKVLASEEPDVIVLNYAPGPVDTQMVQDIKSNTNDKELKEYFTEQLAQKTILTTTQTTEKFISVLENFKFKSGDHVDYYD